jgi:hypothetical protein
MFIEFKVSCAAATVWERHRRAPAVPRQSAPRGWCAPPTLVGAEPTVSHVNCLADRRIAIDRREEHSGTEGPDAMASGAPGPDEEGPDAMASGAAEPDEEGPEAMESRFPGAEGPDAMASDA